MLFLSFCYVYKVRKSDVDIKCGQKFLRFFFLLFLLLALLTLACHKGLYTVFCSKHSTAMMSNYCLLSKCMCMF